MNENDDTILYYKQWVKNFIRSHDNKKPSGDDIKNASKTDLKLQLAVKTLALSAKPSTNAQKADLQEPERISKHVESESVQLEKEVSTESRVQVANPFDNITLVKSKRVENVVTRTPHISLPSVQSSPVISSIEIEKKQTNQTKLSGIDSEYEIVLEKEKEDIRRNQQLLLSSSSAKPQQPIVSNTFRENNENYTPFNLHLKKYKAKKKSVKKTKGEGVYGHDARRVHDENVEDALFVAKNTLYSNEGAAVSGNVNMKDGDDVSESEVADFGDDSIVLGDDDGTDDKILVHEKSQPLISASVPLSLKPVNGGTSFSKPAIDSSLYDSLDVGIDLVMQGVTSEDEEDHDDDGTTGTISATSTSALSVPLPTALSENKKSNKLSSGFSKTILNGIKYDEHSGFPLCPGHTQVCKLRKVKKNGRNKGRLFYCCPYSKELSCGFFLWKDADMYKAIAEFLASMKKEKDANPSTELDSNIERIRQMSIYRWLDKALSTAHLKREAKIRDLKLTLGFLEKTTLLAGATNSVIQHSKQVGSKRMKALKPLTGEETQRNSKKMKTEKGKKEKIDQVDISTSVVESNDEFAFVLDEEISDASSVSSSASASPSTSSDDNEEDLSTSPRLDPEIKTGVYIPISKLRRHELAAVLAEDDVRIWLENHQQRTQNSASNPSSKSFPTKSADVVTKTRSEPRIPPSQHNKQSSVRKPTIAANKLEDEDDLLVLSDDEDTGSSPFPTASSSRPFLGSFDSMDHKALSSSILSALRLIHGKQASFRGETRLVNANDYSLYPSSFSPSLLPSNTPANNAVSMTLQEWAISRILRGKSTLLVAPTGIGKSLTFQIPSLLFSSCEDTSITVVISPLTSLMRDQMLHLPRGLIGICLGNKGSLQNGLGDSGSDVLQAFQDLRAKRAHVLFLSPEKLASRSFLRLANSSTNQLPPVSVVVVDEVHVVSEWSHNFRPIYLRIPFFVREYLKPRAVLALTATATPAVIEMVKPLLGISGIAADGGSGGVWISSRARSNLVYTISMDIPPPPDESSDGRVSPFLGGNGSLFSDREKRLDALLKFLTKIRTRGIPNWIQKWNRSIDFPTQPLSPDSSFPSTIIYVSMQHEADSISNFLNASGFSSAPYHSGLSSANRDKVYSRFMSNSLRIVVATTAFGMGIDKSDIELVLFYSIPRSIEEFIQQSGRAGRSLEKNAWCHSFIDSSHNDVVRLSCLSDSDALEKRVLTMLVKILAEKIQRNSKIRRYSMHSLAKNEHGVSTKLEVQLPFLEVTMSFDLLEQGLNLKQEEVETLFTYLEQENSLQISFNRGSLVSVVISSGNSMESIAGHWVNKVQFPFPTIQYTNELKKQQGKKNTSFSGPVSGYPLFAFLNLLARHSIKLSERKTQNGTEEDQRDVNEKLVFFSALRSLTKDSSNRTVLNLCIDEVVSFIQGYYVSLCLLEGDHKYDPMALREMKSVCESLWTHTDLVRELYSAQSKGCILIQWQGWGVGLKVNDSASSDTDPIILSHTLTEKDAQLQSTMLSVSCFTDPTESAPLLQHIYSKAIKTSKLGNIRLQQMYQLLQLNCLRDFNQLFEEDTSQQINALLKHHDDITHNCQDYMKHGELSSSKSNASKLRLPLNPLPESLLPQLRADINHVISKLKSIVESQIETWEKLTVFPDLEALFLLQRNRLRRTLLNPMAVTKILVGVQSAIFQSNDFGFFSKQRSVGLWGRYADIQVKDIYTQVKTMI
jgi:superfamily II DNA helicase RecQ